VINIDIVLNKNEIFERVKVKGHSGFDKKGEDIVCSAVSSLVQTAYISVKVLLKKANNESYLKFLSTENFEFMISGFPESVSSELRGVTLFLIIGLSEIVKEYKNFVKLEIIRS